MGDRLSMNVFCNDGVSVIETDRGKVSISPREFLAGWQGNPGSQNKKPVPPFGNIELQVRESLDAGTYDVAAWRNDEVRARWTDGSGRQWNIVVERSGQPFKYEGDPTPPAEAERERLIYLNVSVKPKQLERAQPPQPQPRTKSRFD